MNGRKNSNQIIKRLICIIAAVLLVILVFLSFNNTTTEKQIRSTSLKRVITKEDNSERIDYVNDEGIITYAADKHYATKISTKEDNVISEAFFDTDGKPTKQNFGYFYIQKFFNENGLEYKTVYLDAEKNPVITRMGYAMIKREFNEDGKTVSERFYDINEAAVQTSLQGYGCNYEYNDDGRNTKATYLGKDGEPAITGRGFAILRKSYYEEGENEGRVKDEFYYNEKDEPVSLQNGEYGLRKDYDEVGRANTSTYLGIDGKPMATSNGYTTIIRTYYNDDSVKSEFYYDKDGLPTALSKGQYGVLRKDGQSIWLDINGNEIRSFRNLLFGSKWFPLVMCVAIVIVSSFLSTKHNKILLILYGVFILYLTVLNRSESASRINLIPFWSYRQIFRDKELAIEIFNNILLFIPFATILYNIFHTKGVIILALVFSILIETIQYFRGIGYCEIDDIISNTIGGFIGYWIAKHIKKHLPIKQKRGQATQ